MMNAAGEFLDPWGSSYMICLDNGGSAFGNTWIGTWWGDQNGNPGTLQPANDGTIRYRPNTTYDFRRAIGIYSLGPNRADDLAQGPEYDDIANWY
jgi:hypothetical protein